MKHARYGTAIASDGRFFSDANGREVRHRQYNAAQEGNVIAGNFYPCPCRALIEDSTATYGQCNPCMSFCVGSVYSASVRLFSVNSVLCAVLCRAVLGEKGRGCFQGRTFWMSAILLFSILLLYFFQYIRFFKVSFKQMYPFGWMQLKRDVMVSHLYACVLQDLLQHWDDAVPNTATDSDSCCSTWHRRHSHRGRVPLVVDWQEAQPLLSVTNEYALLVVIRNLVWHAPWHHRAFPWQQACGHQRPRTGSFIAARINRFRYAWNVFHRWTKKTISVCCNSVDVVWKFSDGL